MKNEEAKRRIEICRDFLANNYSDMGESNFTAFNVAIKALSQEPCDDAISREAVLDGLKGCICEEWIKTLFATMVKQLPSVTQKSDNKYRKEAKRWKNKWLKSQKSGKWIEHEIEDTLRWVTCSECNCEMHKKFNFCPNCGAKMESEG